MITHEVLVNRSCALSENTFWDTDAQRFLWTDITGGAIWSHDASTDTTTKIYDGPNVGGFTQEADG